MSGLAFVGGAAAASLLLVAGGVAKTARPAYTARALYDAGLPGSAPIVRAGGALEALVGAAALATGSGLPMLAAAVSYLALGAFVLFALLRRLPLATCGCFGEPDTPPTYLHLAVVWLAAAACGAAHLAGAPSLGSVVAAGAAPGLVLVGLVGLTAYLAYLSLGALPRLRTAGRVSS